MGGRDQSERPVAINWNRWSQSADTRTEVTTSFASGHLKGVIVFEKGYSDKTDEAWVVVGISEKTIKAARSIQEMGEEKAGHSGVEEMGQEQKPGNNATGSDELGKQQSETRRTNQKDW